jgi:hypothetical protein
MSSHEIIDLTLSSSSGGEDTADETHVTRGDSSEVKPAASPRKKRGERWGPDRDRLLILEAARDDAIVAWLHSHAEVAGSALTAAAEKAWPGGPRNGSQAVRKRLCRLRDSYFKHREKLSRYFRSTDVLLWTPEMHSFPLWWQAYHQRIALARHVASTGESEKRGATDKLLMRRHSVRRPRRELCSRAGRGVRHSLNAAARGIRRSIDAAV